MGKEEQEGENLISQKIRLIRGFLRMNQTQFADAIGVSRMAVGLWESKARKRRKDKTTGKVHVGAKILPSQENYKKIAELVGIEGFVISTPEIGPEYLYRLLTETKRPGSDSPFTDEELIEDLREYADAGLLKQKDEEEVKKEVLKMVDDNSKTTIALNADEIRKRLADPHLESSEQLKLLKMLRKLVDYEHISNYNHSKKGLTGNREDSFYYGDKKTSAGGAIGGPLSAKAKKELEDLNVPVADSVPPDYMNRVKKQIDDITVKAKEINKPSGSKGSPLETKSNGFWIAVQYFVDKAEVSDCHFFKTMYYDDYEHNYDLWVKKVKLLVRFCTLHNRNEIDLLKAEIERLVGSLFILEKIIGVPQRKEIWVYDRESDKAGKFIDSRHPKWLESLQKSTGINIAYVRDAELIARLIADLSTPKLGRESKNDMNKRIREAKAKVWGQASL